MVYDYIIVGAGLGGLSSALNLVFNNKKVLVLEKNNLPGGLVSTFKKGRFEFDSTLFHLFNYGNENHIGELKQLFEKYDLDIDTTIVPFNALIKILNTKEDYEIKGNFEEFAALLETFKSGSIDSIKNFIKITKEIHDALEEVKNGNTELKEYPNFNKYLGMNVLSALHDLKMPTETIHKLCFLYVELGSPINKLSFIDFADFMYKIIFKKIVVLNNKSLYMVLKIAKKITSKGGKIYYNSLVVQIKNDADIKTVITSDGKEYKCKHVICDLSKRYVLKELIKDYDREYNRIENARTLSPNALYVYLGLNKDYKTLGLNNFHYYEFNNINSEENVKSMMSMNHKTWEAIVPNVVNENASPKNTTILIFKTYYYATNVFDKVTEENYFEVKEELANNLISQFESAFNIDIKEYIEEIEIMTPFDFANYTNNINGSMLGYMRLGYDNSIHRLLAFEDEFIPGISFVGSSSVFAGGADNSFLSGIYITEKLLGEGK